MLESVSIGIQLYAQQTLVRQAKFMNNVVQAVKLHVTISKMELKLAKMFLLTVASALMERFVIFNDFIMHLKYRGYFLLNSVAVAKGSQCWNHAPLLLIPVRIPD